ncbi:MAG: response regulator [Candidatus Hydrogenedentes bacterium]|nr:response regulator [Candidatus Hydrogenedentota bacterium]
MTGELFSNASCNRDILIVDDNPENLKVLGDFLSEQGFDVRVARDGRQAVESAIAAPPEIILLDIHMPVMDGYEACIHLKTLPGFQDVPILFLSALGETFNKVRAFECGAADYITKPFELEEVRVRINNHLQNRRLLAESRAGFRASFEQALTGMAHIGLDSAFLAVNRKLCAMFGCAEAELLALPLTGLVHPDSAPALAEALEAARIGRADQAAGETRFLRKDRTALWCRTTFSLVTVPTTGNQYIAAIIEDITDHKRVLEERRRLAAALEQAAEAIAITDAEGVKQYVNPAYERAFGVNPGVLTGQKLAVLADPIATGAPPEEIWETISAGAVWNGRITRTLEDGASRTEEYTISPLRGESGAIANYVAIARDLTQQVRMEEQLRQSQKMEAIGTLAAGIAHDFNNLLAAIAGFTELSIEELPPDSPALSNLREIQQAVGHAAELVRQILAFGRKTGLEIKPVLLQSIAEDALKLLRRSIPPTIQIHYQPDAGCPPICADATALHQIIMNLCTNAYHAMESKGGDLSLRIAETDLREEPLENHPELAPGIYARMDISDTGHGMDNQTMQRIFEPYFTTKARGSGTGLGLATVHGIVSDLKGAVHVYSVQGSGTTFSIFLPLAQGAVAAEKRPLAAPELASGNERILFIDDERAICQFVTKALSRLGYHPTAMTSPREALALFQEHPGAFDAIVTDEMMPGMRGTELLPQLRAIRPDIPVILYSGFAETIRNTPKDKRPFDAYVMKPMVVAELTRAIRGVLRKTPKEP